MVKKLFVLLVVVMTTMTCYGQDIITFVNGESIKVTVYKVSDSEVRYRLYSNPQGPLYIKPRSDIFSITYSNGSTESFSKPSTETGQVVYYSNYASAFDPDSDDRLRRLKVWSKICKIYGWVNVSCGFICLVASGGYDYDSVYDDFDYGTYYKTMGIFGIIEGGAALIVGYSLQGKRNRLLQERNLVGSVPVFQKEFKLENCTIAPSVNLMSYRNNPVNCMGAGLTISF